MKKIYFILALLFAAVTQSAFSQSISNTDNTITLSGTCLSVVSGTYDFAMTYGSDAGTPSVPSVGTMSVTVVNNAGTVTITGPSGSFPTVANTGYYSLADVYFGTITLVNGPGGANYYFHWDLSPNGNMVGIGDCGTVPIYIDNFTWTLSGSTIHLSWDTELEQNTTYIEIYRNTGSGYYKIGQVAAAGNSSGTRPYSYTDNNPGASNQYYLKMLNSQGTPAKFSNTIVVSCSSCTYTAPAPVYCGYSISGPDHVCSAGTVTPYSLSNAVPDYSTITWAVDNSSVAALHTYPAFDRTQVSLIKKNVAAGVMLTATLSGCTNVISKYIVMGTPDPTISTSLSCPTLSATAGNSPGATNYEWHVVDMTTYTETITNSTSPYKSAYIGGGHTWNIGFQYTNACGVSNPAVNYGFVCQGGGGGGHVIRLSPNPSSGVVTIGLAPAPAPDQDVNPTDKVTRISGNITPAYAGKAAATAGAQMLTHIAPNVMTPVGSSKIYQVKVMDAQGVARKVFTYPEGVENVSVNLSGLINGVYTIQVYDNKTWKSSQVILAK